MVPPPNGPYRAHRVRYGPFRRFPPRYAPRVGDHGGSLPPELVRGTGEVAALRERAERAERELRAVTAQREVLVAVLHQLLDGASPEMIAAVAARTGQMPAAATTTGI